MSVVAWKLLRIMNHTEKYYWKAEPDAVSHPATAKGIMGSVEERCKLVQSQPLSASNMWKTSSKHLFYFTVISKMSSF